VPLLGRLPLIGGLFRYKSKTGKRTNLMVFLRPVIIHGPQESYSVTADRYQYLRARTQDIGRQDVLDRFAPRQPTAEELKKYKKRGDDAVKPREPSAEAPTTVPESETSVDDKPAAVPEDATD
jgi:general secretion pathway protein D